MALPLVPQQNLELALAEQAKGRVSGLVAQPFEVARPKKRKLEPLLVLRRNSFVLPTTRLERRERDMTAAHPPKTT